jgi:hypothetical protein
MEGTGGQNIEIKLRERRVVHICSVGDLGSTDGQIGLKSYDLMVKILE